MRKDAINPADYVNEKGEYIYTGQGQDILYDSDGDGVVDSAVHADESGHYVQATDLDGDGYVDAVIDLGTDDSVEITAYLDSDGNGHMDVMLVDEDGDGEWDAGAVDTDGDGVYESPIVDGLE